MWLQKLLEYCRHLGAKLTNVFLVILLTCKGIFSHDFLSRWDFTGNKRVFEQIWSKALHLNVGFELSSDAQHLQIFASGRYFPRNLRINAFFLFLCYNYKISSCDETQLYGTIGMLFTLNHIILYNRRLKQWIQFEEFVRFSDSGFPGWYDWNFD